MMLKCYGLPEPKIPAKREVLCFHGLWRLIDAWWLSITFDSCMAVSCPIWMFTRNHWKIIEESVQHSQKLQNECQGLMMRRYYRWWFRNPANQLRLAVYPIIYKVFIHPRWFAGFLLSTVWVATSSFTRRQRKLWRSRTTRLRSEASGCAIGDVPPTCMGSILSHSKDPYEPTSLMGCSKFFF